MNPILKRLSQPGISSSTIADLLQKHIGAGSNEEHCRQALEALRKVKDQRTVAPARVLAMLLANGNNQCELVRNAIEQLRNAGSECAESDLLGTVA